MSDKPIKFSEDEVEIKTIEELKIPSESHEIARSELTGTDTQITDLTKRKKKKSKVGKVFWGSFSLLVLSGVSFELYQFIVSLFALSSTLGYGLIALIAVVVSAASFAVFKALRSNKELKAREFYRNELKRLGENKTFGQAQPLLNKISTDINTEIDISKHLKEFSTLSKPTHNDQDLVQIYSKSVLKVLDEQSNIIVSKHSSECALMVALSPLASLDMVLVAWRSSKMVSEISALYGCPQNMFARVGLTKSVLKNLMLTGASELIADAGVELLGSTLTATVSAKAAQGIGVGILISRLGIQTMRLSRPIEYTELNRPRLADMRKALVKKVVKKISG